MELVIRNREQRENKIFKISNNLGSYGISSKDGKWWFFSNQEILTIIMILSHIV